jgi:hypothetical protein
MNILDQARSYLANNAAESGADELIRDLIKEAELHEAKQQLVARIKRSSKYYGQTAPNEWFDARLVNDRSYPLRGNNNNYRKSDVAIGVRLDDGTIIELK